MFMELGSTGNYFRGAREQAHNFGDIGSLAKKLNNKEKLPFCLIFKKKSSASGGARPPPPPLSILNVFIFILTCSSWLL